MSTDTSPRTRATLKKRQRQTKWWMYESINEALKSSFYQSEEAIRSLRPGSGATSSLTARFPPSSELSVSSTPTSRASSKQVEGNKV